MEPISHEDHASHQAKTTTHKEENQIIKNLTPPVQKSWEWIKRLTRLEMVGLVAIFILIATLLFDFNFSVRRKTWVNALLGRTSTAQSAPADNTQDRQAKSQDLEIDPALAAAVLPVEGVILPVNWGDLGKQMMKAGVIDQKKFEDLYAQRGGLDPEMKKMLLEDGNGKIKVTQSNSQTILNLLWGLGLGNKNEILEKGEMQNPQYGGAANFASTGGWSLASGKTMDHYSKHAFIKLTAVQQALVDKVSQGIYRPCCGNSTHFPDCNHGMAMLGLLELMAAQDVSEQDMYKAALAINSFWFPDTYLTIAKYLKTQGQDWNSTPPQVLLGAQYSSGPGYKQILSQVSPVAPKGNGGCGV
ncbi:MAG: hypothetical protein Q8N81_06390 [bacterium]|nr:hypothetical protein [bacterium]